LHLVLSSLTPPQFAAFTPSRADFSGVLILVAIAIGSGIMEWLKKKKEAGTGPSDPNRQATRRAPARPQSSPPRPASLSDWEAELRRLLSGEPPAESPPPPARTPSPPPPARPRPSMPERKPAAPPILRPGLARAQQPVLTPMVQPVIAELPERPFYTMRESVSAYQRASQLQEQVGNRMKRIEQVTERPPIPPVGARREGISPLAAQTVAMFRNPASTRQAILASFILGQPKGLE
jgi:hypothetical protein